MRPGQKIFNLLKAAKGEHVPLSHLAAVLKLQPGDVLELCIKSTVFNSGK